MILLFILPLSAIYDCTSKYIIISDVTEDTLSSSILFLTIFSCILFYLVLIILVTSILWKPDHSSQSRTVKYSVNSTETEVHPFTSTSQNNGSIFHDAQQDGQRRCITELYITELQAKQKEKNNKKKVNIPSFDNRWQLSLLRSESCPNVLL